MARRDTNANQHTFSTTTLAAISGMLAGDFPQWQEAVFPWQTQASGYGMGEPIPSDYGTHHGNNATVPAEIESAIKSNKNIKNTNGPKNMKATLNKSQSISDPKAVIAVYNTHAEAEAAVKELQIGGFDMKKLSVVGKDYHTDEQVVGYYNAGDRMKYWGKLGALWGGLWGLLFGAAFFWVPGIGPLLVAGPLVSVIVGGLEGAVAWGDRFSHQSHGGPLCGRRGGVKPGAAGVRAERQA